MYVIIYIQPVTKIDDNFKYCSCKPSGTSDNSGSFQNLFYSTNTWHVKNKKPFNVDRKREEKHTREKEHKQEACVREKDEQMASLALICGELLPEALVNGSSKM